MGDPIRSTRDADEIATLRRELEELKNFKSAFPPVPDGKIARKMVEDRARAELLAESEEDAKSMMEVLEQRNTLQAEVDLLRELLGCVIPNCEWLHHSKADQHHDIGKCPVEDRLRAALAPVEQAEEEK